LAWAALGAVLIIGCGESPDVKARSNDPPERVAAVQELARDGSEAALAQLEPLAAHEDPRTALEACRAISRTPRPRAARALAGVLRADRRPEIRLEAAIQLGYRPQREAAEALRRAVEADAEPRVRAAAAASLGKIGDLADVPLLVRVAETAADPLLEAAAVEAVERIVRMGFCYDRAASEEDRRQAVRRMRFWALRAAAAIREKRKEEGRP
jgi:HEAT repeat protein